MNNRRRYTQELTYWAPAEENDFGEEAFEAPVAISGRWENRQDKVVTASGEEIVSKAFAYVDVDLQIEGYLALGNHLDQTNPTMVEAAEEIKGTIVISSLRTNTEVKAIIL